MTDQLRDFYLERGGRPLGIRDFIEYLEEHREKAGRPEALSEGEREEVLREAEMMVGMANAAIRELESVIKNRRINLPEEHAVRFAQDVFVYLRGEEEKVKERLREHVS
jgi:phenylalanyl-tRNA synthetase alpha subunit